MNELIYADVRVVPIGMLFEKIRLAAGLVSGQGSTADVRYWVDSGTHLLNSSSSDFDPDVWSGRALQEVFVDLVVKRSCINVSGL
jgi:hypothetical protein